MAEKKHEMTWDEALLVTGLCNDVFDERNRQLEMWGQQDHPVTFARSEWVAENNFWHKKNDQRVAQNTLTWDGILMEEVAEALMETDPHQQRKEFIEVAAVAIAAAEAVDRKIAQQEMDDKWDSAMDDMFLDEDCAECAEHIAERRAEREASTDGGNTLADWQTVGYLNQDEPPLKPGRVYVGRKEPAKDGSRDHFEPLADWEKELLGDSKACGENVDCTSACSECVTMGDDEGTDWLWDLKREGEPEKPRKAGTITFDVQANIQPLIDQIEAVTKALAAVLAFPPHVEEK